jgi:hypothetical protein
MISQKKQARLAGVIYLILAVVSAFSIMIVPSLIIMPGDAAATMRNIVFNEWLFRLGIVGDLLSQVTFLVLALALYRLFREVDKTQAMLMVAMVAVAVAMAFFNMLNHVVLLLLAGGAEFLKGFQPEQLRSLAAVSLNLHEYAIAGEGLYWGLWLLPFGWLVFKSGFIPKTFGVLLLINGVAYVIDSLVYLMSPAVNQVIAPFLSVPLAIGEFSIILWLLIIGARPAKPVVKEGS